MFVTFQLGLVISESTRALFSINSLL